MTLKIIICRNLEGLAFLDLAQNHIQEMSAEDLRGMKALTALNLERNVIQGLNPDVFKVRNSIIPKAAIQKPNYATKK